MASQIAIIHAALVEEQLRFTLVELSQACNADIEHLHALVSEGSLTPEPLDADAVLFAGSSLRRARTATRLMRDLGLNAAGVALAMDLLDEIASLRAQLHRSGGR